EVDLAKIDLARAPVGFTVVARQTLSRIVNNVRVLPIGQVMELDHNSKPRWTIDLDINALPVDAQVVGPNRVLIAEYNAGRVTERDFKGHVKWEKAVPSNPLSVLRLANGHTFVVLLDGAVEYDRTGKEVFRHHRTAPDCFRGAK